MENPYQLMDGETLTLQPLLDQFLNWSEWNYKNNRDHSEVESEDREHLSNEHKAFYELFYQLWHHPGFAGKHFSLSLLKYLVISEGLTIDQSKLICLWGENVDWENVTPFGEDGVPLAKHGSFDELKAEAVRQLQFQSEAGSLSVYTELINRVESASNLEDIRLILSDVFYPKTTAMIAASWHELIYVIKVYPGKTESMAIKIVWDAFFQS